ncbi:hypothetical protein [Nocardioides pacificus]
MPNDEQDAALILQMLLLVTDRDDLNRTKIIRDDIDYIWAKPRETRQGHRKRSGGSWWSPEAIKLRDQKRTTEEDGTVVGTTGEHVVPMRVVIEHLLELTQAGRLTSTAPLLRLLRLPMAVVTVAEDRRLKRQDMPVEWSFAAAEANWDVQIWERYVEAQLPVGRFRQMGRQGVLVGGAPPGFGS